MIRSMSLHHQARLCGRRLPSGFTAGDFIAPTRFADSASRRNRMPLLAAAMLLLCLGMLSIVGARAGAQAGTASTSHNATEHKPATGGDAKPTSSKTGGDNTAHEVPTLDSVRDDVLKPMKDQEVRVQGIIGDYHQTTNRYNFHMNDQSEVEVIGNYPSTAAHTTYALNARVVREGSKYVLSEIRKERVEGGGSGGGMKIDPLLLAGGLLLAAAAVIFIVMTARSKAAAQKQGVEQQIEQERRKAEAARQEAERLRAASNSRAPASGGPGGTVVTTAPGAAAVGASGSKAMPARTIVSVGSVEVISGPHQGQKFPLQHGETRVGRAVKDGIALDRDGEVSSQHGSLIVTVDGRVLYRDESTNGSLLDGGMVHHRQAEAHSGSQLEIGASTLRITLRVPASSPAPQAPSEQAQAVVNSAAVSPGMGGVPSGQNVPALASTPAPQGSRSAATVALEMPFAQVKTPAPATQATLGAELEVLSGPDAGQRFAITRSVMGLGREDQDILLNDESVSRKHATLVYRDGKFLLTDQRSTHGTKVNGEAIGTEARELANGDQIAPGTGKTVLMFHSIHA